MGEADAEPDNVMTELQTKELSQQRFESDSEEDPEEDQENGLYVEISEDPENVMNEEPEEAASEVEIYEESDEDPGNTMVEVSEDDPEEEINEEDEVHKEPDENPEEEIYEESEEESEEEIVEDLGDDPEEEMDEEPEEESEEEIVEDLEDDPEEEIDEESDEEQAVENSNLSLLRGGSADVKGLGHKLNDSADVESRNKMVAIKTSGPISSTVTPSELHQSNNATKHVQHSSRLGKMTLEGCKSQKMIQNEENLKSESIGTFAKSEFDGKIGLVSVTVNDDCASKQHEPGTSSIKHRRSRWDLRAEGETPLIAETGKRRKTRWDNDDSRNFLFQVSSSLELSTNQEVLRLKESLMEINKMLQSSEINGKETAEEISPQKPDNISHGMKINARARRKLKKNQRKILSQLATLLSCQSPYPFTKKIFVPVGEYPTYKFIGLILGPKGNTQKRMEKETGAKIRLRGKGFGDHSETEELHVLVEADNQRALNAAKAMVEKLLIPVADENNEHKKAQLTELAKMRGTYKDQNTCQLCKEQGHREYACPLKDSSFNAACCDTCGGFDHPTSKCISNEKANEKSNKEVDNSTLYVGYLSQVTDEKRLKELFLPFGKIIKAAVIKDPMTGLSKGYGFVEFDKSTDASAAVTYMNGYKMAGKVLAVRIAGQKPVPAPPPTPVPSVIYGQTSGIYGREPSMFPGAQVSFSTSESSYFPYSSGTVARTVGSTIPPYAATSISYPRMNNNDVSSHEFSCQITNSSSNSAISHFHGNPDTGSQFKSYITSSQFNPYITNPAMDEFRTFSQITETKDITNYGQGYRLS
ncbi:uncharacterized protein LOC142532610 [Primulina tabacum]|uniref:uncharacterized protein LOC142532610 n=1 Tax=Primulina tabacum TaxID=48773 RepID=UPI003F5A1580